MRLGWSLILILAIVGCGGGITTSPPQIGPVSTPANAKGAVSINFDDYESAYLIGLPIVEAAGFRNHPIYHHEALRYAGVRD